MMSIIKNLIMILIITAMICAIGIFVCIFIGEVRGVIKSFKEDNK